MDGRIGQAKEAKGAADGDAAGRAVSEITADRSGRHGMKRMGKIAGTGLPGLLLLAGFCSLPAAAQDPVITPIFVDTAVPIVLNALKPKPPNWRKFDGTLIPPN